MRKMFWTLVVHLPCPVFSVLDVNDDDYHQGNKAYYAIDNVVRYFWNANIPKFFRKLLSCILEVASFYHFNYYIIYESDKLFDWDKTSSIPKLKIKQLALSAFSNLLRFIFVNVVQPFCHHLYLLS